MVIIDYIVMLWRQRACYRWDNITGIACPGTFFLINQLDYNTIHIPIDPLTAIAMGMVTAEQLGYPPGILAAFNLLSKEPS